MNAPSNERWRRGVCSKAERVSAVADIAPGGWVGAADTTVLLGRSCGNTGSSITHFRAA